jgi:hypothetical protein
MLKDRTNEELAYIVKDSMDAARAMGVGHPREGFYIDESLEAEMELQRRLKKAAKGGK